MVFPVSERVLSNSCKVGPFSQPVTIEILFDDNLLNIFRQYLDASPRSWPMLASVCKKWRQIILTSPLGLNLRLYCTHGTPVLKAIDCWPALPVVVRYGGFPNLDPPAPEDDDNIIAALKESGRVNSINLTVTNSLQGKLSAISEPFSELEELALLSQDNMPRTLPSTFRWGPHLRTVHLTGIALPSFPQLILPSQGLVDLQLHEIPSAGYFSPEAFANALSGMGHLQSLSLHFLSFPPRRNYLSLPPSGERFVLPSLTRLKYRGTSRYLDTFVARIDAHRLGDIDIVFFNQPTMDALQLGRFIERTEMRTSLSHADIRMSEHAISFASLSTSTPFQIQVSCKQLDWQLFSMAQILNRFSSFISRVQNLGIKTTELPGQNDVGGELWRELVRSFGCATDVSVAGGHWSNILCALGPADGGNTTVLPALRNLRVKNPMAIHRVGPSWDTVQSFIASRSLPDRSNQPSYQCHICSASFGQPQELQRHLGDKHVCRIVCSYCDDFECLPGRNDLFPEHLDRQHPDVAFKDTLMSNRSLRRLRPSQLDNLVSRHSSLRISAIVAPSTTTTAPHSQ